MKLSEQITRRQLFVAFGMSQQSGGLTSVDLAATRDGSQVIVTASDGSAAPISGADASKAGVLTASDKVRLDDLTAHAMRSFDSRAAVSLASIDSAVTHLRTLGYAAAGDGGGALYKRIGSEPGHALKVQSADGAWWEIAEPLFVTFQACGGVEGDDAADGAGNVAAFEDFIGYLQDAAASGSVKGPSLVFPIMGGSGHYHFNSHLNVKAVVHITGPGGWHWAARDAGPVLEFPADSHGLIIHRHNTIDDTTGTSGYSADGSIIENLGIVGGGAGMAAGHGVWVRAFCALRHLYVRAFAEDGYHVVGDIGAGGAVEGNPSTTKIENCTADRNGRNGFYIDSLDANICTLTGCEARQNGRWGFFDSSFLGNTHIGHHETANGLADSGANGGTVTSLVHYNVGGADKHFFANVGATEAQLVATEPGTDESVWTYKTEASATGGAPTWQSGQPEGTYVHGGSYRTDNANARNVFVGCYEEGNSAPPQFESPTTVIGGHRMDEGHGTYAYYGANAIEALILAYEGLKIDTQGDVVDIRGPVEVEPPAGNDSYVMVIDDEDHASRILADPTGNNLSIETDRNLIYMHGRGLRQGSGFHDITVKIRSKGGWRDVVHTAYDLSQLRLVDGVSEPATVNGVAQIFVDGADGDLKCKFGDGTVKSITADS